MELSSAGAALRPLGRPFPANQILVALGAWFAMAKLLAAYHYFAADRSVFDILFGFGDYVRSMHDRGVLEACADGICSRSTRMPLLPIFYAVIAQVSQSLLFVAVVKSLLLSVLLFAVFGYLLRRQRGAHPWAAKCWCLAAGLLTLSPPVIKHASYVDYEEGLLLEILFLWTCAVLVATRLSFEEQAMRRSRGAVILATLLALAAYLAKSSMILVLGLTLLLATAWAAKFRDLRTFGVALLCLVVVLGWGLRNQQTTGRFSVMTSWDGGNAYRGWSDVGSKLYPDVVLDRAFDSDVAFKADGERIAIQPEALPTELRGEWAANDFYLSRAGAWLREHPGSAARFFARKACVFFLGLRKTPYTYTNDARPQTGASHLEGTVTSIWLAAGRCMELAFVVLVVALWRRRDPRARSLLLVAAACCAAYAAPYLAGFGYERHVTVFLVIVSASVAILGAEWLEGKTFRRRIP